MIHNHNWYTSGNWPASLSGQCTIGAVYGTGAVKRAYKLRNIFVETAASCAIGLEISKSAYNRHPTRNGCVGSIVDMQIDGLYFDEEFKTGSGYNNYISGENEPMEDCSGELSGKVVNLSLAVNVAGREMNLDEFVIPNPITVPGFKLAFAKDPVLHSSTMMIRSGGFKKHNLPSDNSASEYHQQLEQIGVSVQLRSTEQCVERCNIDWSCGYVVYQTVTGMCWKYRTTECRACAYGPPAAITDDVNGHGVADDFEVYIRQQRWQSSSPILPANSNIME